MQYNNLNTKIYLAYDTQNTGKTTWDYKVLRACAAKKLIILYNVQ